MSGELNQSYRPKEAAKLLGIGSATLWRWINERPGFPQPTRLSARCTVLDGAELRTWIAQQGSTPKRPPVVRRDESLIPLADLKWCQACGEGVTTFCRAKPSGAPTRTCGMGFTAFDRSRMEKALASESTSIPNGLSPEQIAQFISDRGAGDNLQKRAPDAAAPHVPSPKWEDAPLRMAGDVGPNLQPEDNGPWEVIEWGCGGFAVSSDQFDFDAALIVDGDFVNLAEKQAYAEMIAAKLNSLRRVA